MAGSMAAKHVCCLDGQYTPTHAPQFSGQKLNCPVLTPTHAPPRRRAIIVSPNPKPTSLLQPCCTQPHALRQLWCSCGQTSITHTVLLPSTPIGTAFRISTHRPPSPTTHSPLVPAQSDIIQGHDWASHHGSSCCSCNNSSMLSSSIVPFA